EARRAGRGRRPVLPQEPLAHVLRPRRYLRPVLGGRHPPDLLDRRFVPLPDPPPRPQDAHHTRPSVHAVLDGAGRRRLPARLPNTGGAEAGTGRTARRLGRAGVGHASEESGPLSPPRRGARRGTGRSLRRDRRLPTLVVIFLPRQV